MTIKRILGLFFLIALISLFAIVYYPETTEITSIDVNKDPIYSNQNSMVILKNSMNQTLIFLYIGHMFYPQKIMQKN